MSYVEQLRKKIGHDEYIGVGAGIFVYKDRNVLLQKRKDNGCWSMHAGGLEIGETVEEAAKRPAYLLLENVPGLLNHDRGRTFAAILHTLDRLGYGLEWQVLNSKDFGVPQSRKRVYVR